MVTRLLAPLPTHFRPDYVRACVDTKTVVTHAGLNVDSAADEDRGLRVDGSAMGRVGEPKRRGLKDLYKDLIDPRGMHVPLGNAATGFKHHEADADVAVTFLIFSHPLSLPKGCKSTISTGHHQRRHNATTHPRAKTRAGSQVQARVPLLKSSLRRSDMTWCAPQCIFMLTIFTQDARTHLLHVCTHTHPVVARTPASDAPQRLTFRPTQRRICRPSYALWRRRRLWRRHVPGGRGPDFGRLAAETGVQEQQRRSNLRRERGDKPAQATVQQRTSPTR